MILNEQTEITVNESWVAELAAQVGAEVEKLVQPAPSAPSSVADRAGLLTSVDIRAHMDVLYGQTSELFKFGEDVFIGDIKNGTKVETLSHLKKMINEVKSVELHQDYAGGDSVSYVSAKISHNYVGKIREARLKDLSPTQLEKVRFSRKDGLLTMQMVGDAFFTDESFGLLVPAEVKEVYGRVYFKIDTHTGMLVSLSVGPDPKALPVEDLEHEYVSIV